MVHIIFIDLLNNVLDSGLLHGLDKCEADQEVSLRKIKLKELIHEIGYEALNIDLPNDYKKKAGSKL